MDLRPFMERWHMLPPSGGVMLVAVSGGRDSVCLLHYLAAMPRDFTVAAAHLNHGQRPTAGRDVDFVRQLCRELDVPLTVERADVPALARERGVGLEEAGRMARYDFFRRTADRLGAQRIATAHHAADQAETVVLNLVRGTGMQGLAGIPPVRGRIVRPLLETSREEIETYLEIHRLSHVEDETNRDTALRRNLLRREVMPRLAELHDGTAAQHLPHGGAAAAGGRVSGRPGGGLSACGGAYRRAGAAAVSAGGAAAAGPAPAGGAAAGGEEGLHRRPLPGAVRSAGGGRYADPAGRGLRRVPGGDTDASAPRAVSCPHGPAPGGECLGRIHNFRPENRRKFFSQKRYNCSEL